MNIAIIPSADLSYNSGSVIYAKELYKFLIDNHCQAYLLGSEKPNDLKKKYMKNIFIKENILEHPIIDDREITNDEYIKMFSEIVNYIMEVHRDSGGLDIIHAHYASINSYAALFASKLIDVPVIISSFGRDINIGYKKDNRIKKMIITSVREANGIIVVDKNIKKKVESIVENESDKIEVIGMPIDYSILNGKTKVVKKNNIVITTINSCFSDEKGIALIVEAFSIINIKYKNTILYIAGCDDHPNKIHEKKIKKQIKEKKLHDKVVFTGYLSREDIGILLKETDIYVDARENSNFSSVLLEAMIMGAPIVASRNEGSKKVIKENYNGLLFEKRSVEELMLSIEKLISNTNERVRIVNNAKLWISNEGLEYLPEKCFQSVLNFYYYIKEKNKND